MKRRAGRIERPLVRWHGGKWMISRWIVDRLPPHLTYCEPFGGGASVLLRKPPSVAEIYNDLDGTITTVFRVLRDPDLAAQLVRAVELTPYSRAEFADAYKPTSDPVEAARRTIVRSHMGFGADGALGGATGFRGAGARAKQATTAQEWSNYPIALRRICARIQTGVMIEQMDALDLMRKVDAPDTLVYLDPPYPPETRSVGSRRKGRGYHAYNHELTTEEHAALLDFVKQLESMVIISGYPSDLYDRALAGWTREEMETFADGARPRVEVIWSNPAASAALEAHKAGHGPLFATEAA